MCIIAIYKKGTQPQKTILERMIKTNPDGVGVAWNDGSQVHFRKGLQTADDVLAVYESAKATAQTFIFHARIATSGGISAEKCHPFMLATNNTALNATQYDGKRACAFHNGVFSLTPEDGLNDTQTLIKRMIAPLYLRDKSGVLGGEYSSLIAFLTKGSRFVIMHPDKIQAFGDWQTSDGVLYSNGGYKPATLAYGWDVDEEDGFRRYVNWRHNKQ